MNLRIRALLILTLLFISVPCFSTTVTINIKNLQFQASAITINLGDSVKWVNQDGFTHSVTEDNNRWPSKDISAGASYSRLFNTEGVFIYHCRFHFGMTGKITVRTAEQTRIQTGKNIINLALKILPITLNLTGKNSNMVYLGSYIVNAQSGCANCHSCPTYAVGRNPYLKQPKQLNATSYLAGGVTVQGISSANLTPDASGKPAGLTLSQFKDLLRNGHDPDAPGLLLPVMPWPLFGMMSEHDLDAVYTYLQTIPKATTPTKACVPGQ